MYLKHTAYLFIAKLCQSLMGFVSFARLHGLPINAVQPLLWAMHAKYGGVNMEG